MPPSTLRRLSAAPRAGRLLAAALAAIIAFAYPTPATLVQGTPEGCPGAEPGDLAPLDCGQEGTIRSIEGEVLSSITFVNATEQTLEIYWLNYQGAREHFHTLAAGTSYVQGAYLTHAWLVIGEDDRCFGIYLPEAQPTRALICDGKPAAVAELSWNAPSGGALSPPTDLTVQVTGIAAGRVGATQGSAVTAYKVYRSNSPNVGTDPRNYFATIPPTRTQTGVAVASGGSYFVVTACYAEGGERPVERGRRRHAGWDRGERDRESLEDHREGKRLHLLGAVFSTACRSRLRQRSSSRTGRSSRREGSQTAAGDRGRPRARSYGDARARQQRSGHHARAAGDPVAPLNRGTVPRAVDRDDEVRLVGSPPRASCAVWRYACPRSA